MKRLLACATALGALAYAVPAAQAAVTISAAACVPGSLAIPCVGAQIATGSAPLLSVPAVNIGAFTISGSATTATTPTSAVFNSQTIQISSTTGGLLDIYFTVSGVPTIGVPLAFTSTFTSNQQNADTHSVIESTFLSNTDGKFDAGLGTPLSSATLTNSVLQTAGPFSVTETPAATVSLTHLYQIQLSGCADQTSGTCTGNLTIDLSAARVAEPGTMALLGVGMLGLGMVGLRKRR